MLKLHMLLVIVRSVFKGSKYYPQVFLDECSYEVNMLEYDRIDISKGTDINKTNASKECHVCHYCYFLDKKFKCEPYLSNGCHDLMQNTMNFNGAAIVSVKGSDYRIRFWYMTKNDAIYIMINSNLNQKGGSL